MLDSSFSHEHLTQKRNWIIALLLCSIIFYGFSLPFSLSGKPHFSPSNDFSNHAHYMHSFADSFKSGQLIPRTIATPTEFSDATLKTDTIPTFQYYGFFEGLAALPFHFLGLSDATIAVLCSISVRFLGLLILFETCLLMGASLPTAFLASFSLLISPYTLTVFYGRGALAETFAQSLLALIPYGFMLAYRKRFYEAITAFTLAFFFLPLCHNIFFLYGAIFLVVLTLCSFSLPIIFSAGIGSLLGVLMSAWQWLPAQHTIKDTVIFGGLFSWKIGGGGVETHTASLNGALGIPQPWTPDGFTHALPLYHTISWWALPCIILLIKGIYQNDKARFTFPLFMCSILFFMMTFWPFSEPVYRYLLPQFFNVVQDTSRLIGFITLLSALALAIAIPKINSRLFKLLLVLMVASQLPVFNCFLHLVAQQTWENNQIASSPINYYYSSPNVNNSPNQYTQLLERLQIKRSDGSFNINNSFYISPKNHSSFFVHLTGKVNSEQPTHISLVALKQNFLTQELEATTITSTPATIQSYFSTILNMKTISPSGWYKIISTPTDNNNKLPSPITLFELDILPNDWSNFIPGDYTELSKQPWGYSRQYHVKKNEIMRFKPDASGFYTLELPVAYSQLFSVMQNKKDLQFIPDFNHRILLQTSDLNSPINISYKLDLKTILLTLLGMLGFMLISVLHKKQATYE